MKSRCPRPCKPLLLKLGEFLLLGAIVNVAVAWGCALLSDPCQSMSQVLAASEGEGEPPSLMLTEGRAFGTRVFVLVRGFGEVSRTGPFSTIDSLLPSWAKRDELYRFNLQIFDARGLPCLCLHSALETPPPLAYQFQVHGSIQTGLAPRAIGWLKIPRVLPYRAIWPGFAINTIFYAAMLWLLWIARRTPGKVRRFVRVSRGRCPACGFIIAPGTAAASGGPCSECGFRAGIRD